MKAGGESRAPEVPGASLTFISFGSDWRYQREAKAMLMSGCRAYPEAAVRIYGAKDLPESLRAYASLFPRGFGYWVWKAWVINQALAKAADESVIVYVDARSRVPAVRVPWLDEFISSTDLDVAAWQMTHEERRWTTSDLMNALQVNPNSELARTGQFAATFLALRAGPKTRALVSRWLDFQIAHDALVRAERTQAPDYDLFVENRFDQSVFSLLVKSEQGRTLNVLVVTDEQVASPNSITPHASPHPDFFYPLTHTKAGKWLKSLLKSAVKGR